MNDFIYISIPRTGTHSVHNALNYHLDNHTSIRLIDRKGISFAFIRHPFDLLVSWYQFHRQMQKQWPQYHCDFMQWIERGCPHHWSQALLDSSGVSHPCNQWEYVCNKDGVILVDFIGKFEELQSGVNFVCRTVGINEVKLPHINGSKHQKWESLFTPKMVAQAKEQFKKDFELFNFE